MTPQQQGRFCDSCQKCVVDFTGFSDEQLYKFFQQHKGQQVCGRFSNKQLNKAILLPYQPNSKLYHWLAAAGIILFTVATTGTTTFASPPFTTSIAGSENIADDTAKGNTITLHGKVVDENNEPIFGASVTILKDGLPINRAITDEHGLFKIGSISESADKISCTYIGYEFKEIVLNTIDIAKNISIQLEVDSSLPEYYGTIGYAVPLIDEDELPPVKDTVYFKPPGPSLWYRITHPFRRH